MQYIPKFNIPLVRTQFTFCTYCFCQSSHHLFTDLDLKYKHFSGFHYLPQLWPAHVKPSNIGPFLLAFPWNPSCAAGRHCLLVGGPLCSSVLLTVARELSSACGLITSATPTPGFQLRNLQWLPIIYWIFNFLTWHSGIITCHFLLSFHFPS